ncbi:hypothetical protein B0H10DRAFT_2221501 [Mycena sp. CBHHK59/15]|nr:hypothetical protein B0H10DRAFT_2221501 [Mycena sp. CBHHK59/15]
MPIPRTPNPPYFNGKYLTDFLTVLVQHGVNAEITDADADALVLYILQYSSDEVKDLIRYVPEFDPDEPSKTWRAAKETLQLFGMRAEEHILQYEVTALANPDVDLSDPNSLDRRASNARDTARTLLDFGEVLEVGANGACRTGIKVQDWLVICDVSGVRDIGGPVD